MTKSIVRTAAAALAVLLAFPTTIFSQASEESFSRRVSDYTGAGSVVALVGAGFSADHPVFAEVPPDPALAKEAVEEILPGAYLSEKIPAAWDYCDRDADVTNSSFVGTSAASLAAGRYTGKGDIEQEDGTVLHDASFAGSAPDAQLLLFKAAPDYSVRIQPAAAAEAIRDAVLLGADVIWLDTESLSTTDALLRSLEQAEAAGIPVLVGAGDISGQNYIPEELPVTYTDRGTLSKWASLPGVTAVGAASNPYLNVSSFRLSYDDKTEEITYTDSCMDYFGTSFAALTAGASLPMVIVPGLGTAADYENIDVSGAIAVVLRGEIPFTEKAQYAAEAGAVALIVADNGSGLSRMALEGATIPAVMVDTASGERIRSLENAVFSVPDVQPSPASFSASGIAEDLLSCPGFLCEGQKIAAAVTSSSDNKYFADVSGTRYAAAAGAGYIARAAEYRRIANLKKADTLALTLSSAQPLTDSEGDMLSPRTAGCGIVSGNGFYASSAISSAEGSAVSLPGRLMYSSAVLNLRITNTTAQKQRYTVGVSVLGEAYTEKEDGMLYFADGMEPLEDFRAYMGDSYVNICTNGDNIQRGILTLEPGEQTEVSIRISLPSSAKQELLTKFWNGFFADGAVIVTDEAGETVCHPFSLFFGDWGSAPLCDVSVYSEETPLISGNCLYVRRFDEEGDTSLLPLGAANPYTTLTYYDEAYNLVNPALLRYGWTELELYALRNIDHISITFYDSERHVVLSRTSPAVDKYLTAGKAILPLWDFIALDEPDYFFLDGTYNCEIRLSSSFGDAGDAVQYLGFSFIVDSEKPKLDDLHISTESGLAYLTVEAADNEALLDITVYDTFFSYGITEKVTIAGEKTASVTFDVTRYDAIDPLYIEITDRAGSYTVIRISPEEFENLLLEATEGEAP